MTLTYMYILLLCNPTPFTDIERYVTKCNPILLF